MCPTDIGKGRGAADEGEGLAFQQSVSSGAVMMLYQQNCSLGFPKTRGWNSSCSPWGNGKPPCSESALCTLPCSTVCSATTATSAAGGKPLPLGWRLQQLTALFRHASSLCPSSPPADCCFFFSPLSIFVGMWEIISVCTLAWILPVGSTCLFSLCCCDALLLHAGHRWGTTFPAFPVPSDLISHPTMRELLIWKLVQGWTGRCADSCLSPSSVSLFCGWSQCRINPCC